MSNDNSSPSTKKLFVGNLPFDVNDADLVTVFSVVGKVVSANVVINRKSGRSKGFAFIEMETDALAQEVIQKFEGATLNERALTVQFATPKQADDAKKEAAAETSSDTASQTQTTTQPESSATPAST